MSEQLGIPVILSEVSGDKQSLIDAFTGTVAKRKKPSGSPTQRSLKYWREQGYVCAIVEHWNPHARIRQDLFGFIDVIAVNGEDIVGIQACSGSGGHSAERVRKITESANYPLICKAIRIVVQSWRKNSSKRWVSREVEL